LIIHLVGEFGLIHQGWRLGVPGSDCAIALIRGQRTVHWVTSSAGIEGEVGVVSQGLETTDVLLNEIHCWLLHDLGDLSILQGLFFPELAYLYMTPRAMPQWFDSDNIFKHLGVSPFLKWL
jgi:hypothetical protein